MVFLGVGLSFTCLIDSLEQVFLLIFLKLERQDSKYIVIATLSSYINLYCKVILIYPKTGWFYLVKFIIETFVTTSVKFKLAT